MTATPPGGFKCPLFNTKRFTAKKTGSSRPDWRPDAVRGQVEEIEDTSNQAGPAEPKQQQLPPRKRRRSTPVNYEYTTADLGPETQEGIAAGLEAARKTNERLDRQDRTFLDPALEDTPRRRQRTQVPSPEPEPELPLPPNARYKKERHNNRQFDKCKPETKQKRKGYIKSISTDWNMSWKSWHDLPSAPTFIFKSGGVKVKAPHDWNNPLLIRLVDLARLTRKDYQRAAAAIREEMSQRHEGAQLCEKVVSKVMDTLTAVSKVAPVAPILAQPPPAAPRNLEADNRALPASRQETPLFTPPSPAVSRSQTMSPQPGAVQTMRPRPGAVKTEAVEAIEINSDSDDEAAEQAHRVRVKRLELRLEEEKLQYMERKRKRAFAS